MRSGNSSAGLLLTGAVAVALLSCEGAPQPRRSRHPTVAFHEEAAERLHEDYAQVYAFSDDWFSTRIPTWRRVFAHLKGKPDLRYLEIGVYEGRSFIWMLDNVLTDPTARLTAVDIFTSPEVQRRFLDNVELSGQGHRVTTIKGYSSVELRKLPLDSFDIIYIDGSHTADDVLADATLGWGLLKTGGILVFDDYSWMGAYYTGPESHLPPELLPRLAIDAFIQTHRNYVEILSSDYQMMLRRRDNPCPNKSVCSPIGQYVYDWRQRKLFRGSDLAFEQLSARERRLLEEILWERGVGRETLVLPKPFHENPEARALLNRLAVGVAPLVPNPAHATRP